MPRKQRFKPSRKPKPMPEAQVQDLDRSNEQRTDSTGAPEADHPEGPVEPRPRSSSEEAEAR